MVFVPEDSRKPQELQIKEPFLFENEVIYNVHPPRHDNEIQNVFVKTLMNNEQYNTIAMQSKDQVTELI